MISTRNIVLFIAGGLMFACGMIVGIKVGHGVTCLQQSTPRERGLTHIQELLIEKPPVR